MQVAETYNPKLLKLCAWMGPLFVALFVIGAVSAGFFPPPLAAIGADVTTASYVNNLGAIRFGCIVMEIASTLFAPFGLAIAFATRRAENGFPVLFYLQLLMVAISTIVILYIPLFWGIAAFRPGDVSPEITQTWNDGAWFGVYFTWPPFTLWCFAIAAAILGDKSAQRFFPRWVGFLNIWAGIIYAPAALTIYFKSGAFSWNGIICFWLVVVVFFIWIVTMSALVIRGINAEQNAAV
jgi:hypothetical protein